MITRESGELALAPASPKAFRFNARAELVKGAVRAYPALERAWQVSEGGGAQTRWSRDGREIYYRSDGRLFAATFDGSGDEPRLGRPTALFADEYDFGPGIPAPTQSVTPDGRFVFLRRTPSSGRLPVVLGWLPELERLIAAGGAR